MIRMILIYTGLFIVALGALWFRGGSDDAVAQINDAEMRSQTEAALAGLGASFAAPVSEVSAIEVTSAQANDVLTTQVLAQLGLPDTPEQRRGVASLIAQRLAEDESLAQLQALAERDLAASAVEAPRLLTTGTASSDLSSQLTDIVTIAASTGTAPVEEPASRRPNLALLEALGPSRIYLVQSGDNLRAIARRFYGDEAAHQIIYEANRTVLASPNSIQVGQRLRMP